MSRRFVARRAHKMGDGFRSLFDSGVNASYPDLSKSVPTSDLGIFSNRSGLPPGTTVDQLWLYRRKKPSTPIKDEIDLNTGSFENIKTEYKRRFYDHFKDGLSSGMRDSRRIQRPSDNLQLIDFRLDSDQSPSRKVMRNSDDEDPLSADEMMRSESHLRYGLPSHISRRSLKRRKSTHDLIADPHAPFNGASEQSESFIEYLLSQRPAPQRRATSLRLEGDMSSSTTETRSKFVPLQYEPRPPLEKRATNLHLEGELDVLTENLEKYVAFELQRRPPLEKKLTHLHMEGDMFLEPEYAKEFVPFPVLERVQPKLPMHNLKVDGGFYDLDTEHQTKFVRHDLHPMIPFLRSSSPSPSSLVLGTDDTIRSPEYRDRYLAHPKGTRSVTSRPSDFLKQQGDFFAETESRKEFLPKFGRRAEMSKKRTNLNLFGEQCGSPEYRERYVDFPRQRPTVRRPAENIVCAGELEYMTEKRSQYVDHKTTGERAIPMRRQPELRLEGEFECQPEYRKAFIDYLIRERAERKARPLDNIVVSPPAEKASSHKSAIPGTNLDPLATASASDNRSLSVIQSKAASKSAPKPRSLIPVLSPSSQSTSQSQSSPMLDSDGRSPTDPTTRTAPTRIPRRIQIAASSDSCPHDDSLDTVRSRRPPRCQSQNLTRGRSISRPPRGTTSRIRSKSQGRGRATSESDSAMETVHVDRTGSRFSSPVRVEDLAYVPATSPIPLNFLYPREAFARQQQERQQRRHDFGPCQSSSATSSVEREHEHGRAFYVIDAHVDSNNNVGLSKSKRLLPGSTGCIWDGDSPAPRWMPSWRNTSIG